MITQWIAIASAVLGVALVRWADRVARPQWTKAHSPAAAIPASTNHAPQLAPVRKSPIAAPFICCAHNLDKLWLNKGAAKAAWNRSRA